jgi:hypothetical protein
MIKDAANSAAITKTNAPNRNTLFPFILHLLLSNRFFAQVLCPKSQLFYHPLLLLDCSSMHFVFEKRSPWPIKGIFQKSTFIQVFKEPLKIPLQKSRSLKGNTSDPFEAGKINLRNSSHGLIQEVGSAMVSNTAAFHIKTEYTKSPILLASLIP